MLADVSFNGIENFAGLSLGLLLIVAFMKMIVWFVGELRGQVTESHDREELSESRADMLHDKFADEAAARARLEVEVQFLSAALKASQQREISLSREIELLKEEIKELRRILDEKEWG